MPIHGYATRNDVITWTHVDYYWPFVWWILQLLVGHLYKGQWVAHKLDGVVDVNPNKLKTNSRMEWDTLSFTWHFIKKTVAMCRWDSALVWRLAIDAFDFIHASFCISISLPWEEDIVLWESCNNHGSSTQRFSNDVVLLTLYAQSRSDITTHLHQGGFFVPL